MSLSREQKRELEQRIANKSSFRIREDGVVLCYFHTYCDKPIETSIMVNTNRMNPTKAWVCEECAKIWDRRHREKLTVKEAFEKYKKGRV